MKILIPQPGENWIKIHDTNTVVLFTCENKREVLVYQQLNCPNNFHYVYSGSIQWLKELGEAWLAYESYIKS